MGGVHLGASAAGAEGAGFVGVGVVGLAGADVAGGAAIASPVRVVTFPCPPVPCPGVSALPPDVGLDPAGPAASDGAQSGMSATAFMSFVKSGPSRLPLVDCHWPQSGARTDRRPTLHLNFKPFLYIDRAKFPTLIRETFAFKNFRVPEPAPEITLTVLTLF